MYVVFNRKKVGGLGIPPVPIVISFSPTDLVGGVGRKYFMPRYCFTRKFPLPPPLPSLPALPSIAITLLLITL